MRVILLALFVGLVGLTASGCGKGKVSREAAERSKGHDAGSGSDIGGEDGGRPAPTSAPAPSPAVADPVVGMEKRAKAPKDNGLQAGILTAGSFDDNLDPLFFRSFVAKSTQLRTLGNFPGKLQGQRLQIRVKDDAGKPIGNARVKLSAGTSSAELLTRSDGRAVFVTSWDQLPDGAALTASVVAPDGSRTASETIAAGAARWEITLPGVQARLPKNLDLAIILDTTGSMGDELEHLKAEIRGISAAIRRKFPEVNQRFALVLYRDEGDAYVVRSFDFTASLDEFHRRLSAQSANGGGDYPEAVHRGLEAANQLRWREQDTARVAFVVGDAPPHAQFMGRTMAAANALRKKGVSIYPVACSGYDDACEFVMRSCAFLTGSQFLFLTDDSGVGAAHGEPRIPFYQVERLERLMIRMIAGELAGTRVEAERGDIIRTVGKKIN